MSKKECENHCTLPLRFPRRPGTVQNTINDDEGCFCKSGVTRISRDNRPALSRFNYRIGTYGSIREYLFNRIDITPELQNWTHRGADDPAVALLEGAAILGDILSFYQETYANEAYLRTAQWRESIADLVRLLGYRLSPSVGGKAVFAFEIKKDAPVTIPSGFPVKATLEKLPDPADFETTEEITAFPCLNRFNLFRPFEDGDITPETTEFQISSPEQLTDPVDLKVGDRLLVGEPRQDFAVGSGGELSNAEIVILDSIREQHGCKFYTIKGKLQRTTDVSELLVYRLGRTFHHFGYDSPARIVDTSSAVTSTVTVSEKTTSTTASIPHLKVPRSRPVNNPKGFYSHDTIEPNVYDTDFPLDSEAVDLPNNVPVVVQAMFLFPNSDTKKYQQIPDNDFSPTQDRLVAHKPIPVIGVVRMAQLQQTVVRVISDVRSVTMTWGGASRTVSRLRLNEKLGTTVDDSAEMRITDALLHEVTSPAFTFRRAKKETDASVGSILNFYGTAEQVQALQNRRVMLKYPNGVSDVVTVTNVPDTFDPATESFMQLHRIALSAQVSYSYFSNADPGVTVFGNLADADQGKTMPETPIGSGDATLPFQNFKLPKAPLTYHVVSANTPPETPEIEIYVVGRRWTQVDSFFGHGKDEQIFIVREDGDGNSWVQFGDGKTGAKLPSGINNVTAVYRTGTGAYGPLKADTKVQASAKLRNLDKIGMPSDATGGSPSENGEKARNAAPGKVQSLGRLVSLKDFEAEAAAISGVSLASAAWRLVDNIPSVVIAVLMETGRSKEIAAVRDTLNSINTWRGSSRQPVEVVLGKRMYVAVTVQYALKPAFRADLVGPFIRLALGVNYAKPLNDEDQTGLFSLRRRRFGAREYASSIEGTVQNVEGVLWARAVSLTGISDADDPDSIVLPATTVLKPIVPCDGEHVLSLYSKHLLLREVKGEGS